MGDLEEGAPIIGEAIAGGWREKRIGVGDGPEVIESPASELSGEEAFEFEMRGVEACEFGVGGASDM